MKRVGRPAALEPEVVAAAIVLRFLHDAAPVPPLVSDGCEHPQQGIRHLLMAAGLLHQLPGIVHWVGELDADKILLGARWPVESGETCGIRLRPWILARHQLAQMTLTCGDGLRPPESVWRCSHFGLHDHDLIPSHLVFSFSVVTPERMVMPMIAVRMA